MNKNLNKLRKSTILVIFCSAGPNRKVSNGIIEFPFSFLTSKHYKYTLNLMKNVHNFFLFVVLYNTVSTEMKKARKKVLHKIQFPKQTFGFGEGMRSPRVWISPAFLDLTINVLLALDPDSALDVV